MSQCHHNCVMTKHPGFSSSTAWHQDIRYWSFDAPELVSVWLALGSEREENGALWVIPGSHRLRLDRGRFDRHLFLRPELDANRALIDTATLVELEAGDALFFHCRLFHAAGKNRFGRGQALRGVHLPRRRQPADPGHAFRSLSVGSGLTRPAG